MAIVYLKWTRNSWRMKSACCAFPKLPLVLHSSLCMRLLINHVFNEGYDAFQFFSFSDNMLTKFYTFPVFLTGRDRLHVRGIQNRGIVFRCPETFSEKDYPRSLTCHSILYLPKYSTMQRMEEALHTAIDSHRGFASPEILYPWSPPRVSGLSCSVSQPWILLFLLTSNQYKKLTVFCKHWLENLEIIKF